MIGKLDISKSKIMSSIIEFKVYTFIFHDETVFANLLSLYMIVNTCKRCAACINLAR